jgi:hypothetical protein
MPMVVSPPEPRRSTAKRFGGPSTVGDPSPLEVLRPSSGALAPAPAPAPHRALALDAYRLQRAIRDATRRPPLWTAETFGREVDLIRRHLAPLRQRRNLAASFGREAIQSLDDAPANAAPNPAALGSIRVAYAIRWLELGGLGALPPFETLLVSD